MEMFVHLDLVGSYLANVISALQCMFNCASAQALPCPLLYNCIMTLFNLVKGRKTKDWFKDHGAKMPLFPTYIALLSDKVFVGFVKSAENYTNQCAVKDGLVINLDTVDLTKVLGTFYDIVKEIKKCIDYDKLWVDYPAFLSSPPEAAQEGSSKKAKVSFPTEATTPNGGGCDGRGGSPGHGDSNAGHGAGRGARRGSGANTWGAGTGFGAGSFGDTAGFCACNDKGCYVLLGGMRDPARTLCAKA
jgi:hypothetical protein